MISQEVKEKVQAQTGGKEAVMFKISIDPYRKQTNQDFVRVWKLLKLQAEWDQEDVNAAYDRIGELEKERSAQVDTICRLERENGRLRKEKSR